jgi:alkanesulfonate monooxygenase SsuD/methylene tetrahydromethanopterin reductase-like flavin-dependent oxidoreductase (luciferase family)
VNVAGIRRLRAISKSFDSLAYEEAQKNYQLVVGTPDTVIEKLRYVRDLLGIGHLCMWAHDGYISHEDTVRSIELLGKKVLPALRES